jgi:hypothetical protein
MEPTSNQDSQVLKALEEKAVAFFKKNLLQVLVVAVVAAGGSAAYFYTQAVELRTNPNQAAEKENQELLADLGKLILLPEGETPTIATVSDPEKLKDQPFFAKAKVGDKVLIYTNARKAILYDAEANKIIEVAPVNIGPSPSPK